MTDVPRCKSIVLDKMVQGIRSTEATGPWFGKIDGAGPVWCRGKGRRAASIRVERPTSRSLELYDIYAVNRDLVHSESCGAC